MKASASILLRALGPGTLAVVAGFAASHSLRNASISAAPINASAPREPVLVELFTSEGCSSCPPADALLARLDATQFVAGVEAIVLSEHVTYWNQLGWRDPFSSDAMTERQNHYAQQFGLSSVYTPQAVVDGSQDVLGSDPAALGRALARAGKRNKVQLEIKDMTREGSTLHFTVHADSATHATLMAALADDATQSSVGRGENAGRTLRHVAVVRQIKEIGGNATDGSPLTITIGERSALPLKLRLVVFLVNAQTGEVQGVSEQPVAE
jgi:hypothetical protein